VTGRATTERQDATGIRLRTGLERGLRKGSAAQVRLNSRLGRTWRALPLWVRVLLVIALYFAIAILVPSSPVARIMAPQSAWSIVISEQIGVFILLAIGLNVVVGMAGMLDLGYVAFYAVGAYTLALLATRHHWDFWVILPMGIAAAVVAGLVLGAPTLRLRGDYLAIVTLGFGLIISTAANNFSFDGGPQGISNIPHPPSVGHVKALNFGVLDGKPYFYLVLAAIFLTVFMVRRLERSRVGRAWGAVREDEDAAELMGVPTYRFRLLSFAFGAAIGGGAGVFFASQTNHIDPSPIGAFTYQVSILVLAAVVLGGSGNLFGVILGGFLVAWLPERFRTFANDRILIFGAALVIMMIVRPEGIWPSRRRQAEITDTGSGGGINAPLLAASLDEDT
jgi:branched-chain amino acid transport system permease protein